MIINKKSLLWKISGNGLKKPSYLLGTMHMICANDFEIKEKVLKALKKCNSYFMEVDLGSASEIGLMENNKLSSTNLTDGLNEKEITKLEEILNDQFGLTIEEARQLPPAALANRIATEAMDCDEIKIAEMELMMLAHNEGMITGGIETAQEQVDIAQKVFDGKELLSQLKSASSYKHLLSSMVKAYHEEDLKTLASLVTDKRFMTRAAFRTLVINRNKKWAKRIPLLIKDESIFIAVGAGHLPGEEGLLQLLSNQGYIINPVYR